MTRVQIARTLDRLCRVLCVGLIVFFLVVQTEKVIENIYYAVEASAPTNIHFGRSK